MVSVIIPCFNGYRYMERCLKALEQQTCKDFEVVIIDDCSTDDSYLKLKKYQENSKLKIELIKNYVNLGPGKSREKGIKACHGDLIAFCDCDDWYEDVFIESMTKELVKQNADIVMCDNFRVNKKRKWNVEAVKKIAGNKSKEEILAFSPMSLWRLIVKKKLFKKIEFLDIYYGEDGAILYQLLEQAEKIAVIDKPLYNYYLRNSSASSSPSQRAFYDEIKAYATIKRNLSADYKNEIEFIGVKMVLYEGTVVAFKSGISRKDIDRELIQIFGYGKEILRNSYIMQLNRLKKVYVYCICTRKYGLAKWMVKIHKLIR
mgnify:CR=1 FL=1